LLRDAIHHNGEREVASIVRALAIIAKAVAFSKLELRHLVATMGFGWPMEREIVLSLEYMFNKLQTLCIDINLDDNANTEIDANGVQNSLHELSSSQHSHDADKFSNNYIMPRILEGAQTLQYLSISFPRVIRNSWPSNSLESYIGKKSWPYLNTLYLSRPNIDARSLLRIIERNGRSLKVLRLTHTRFRGPDWPLFFDTLREFSINGELELNIFLVYGWLMWPEPADSSTETRGRGKHSNHLPEDYDEAIDGKFGETEKQCERQIMSNALRTGRKVRIMGGGSPILASYEKF
jgi:hypothetical protein